MVGRASCVLSNIKRPISMWHFHTYHEIGLYIQHPVCIQNIPVTCFWFEDNILSNLYWCFGIFF